MPNALLTTEWISHLREKISFLFLFFLLPLSPAGQTADDPNEGLRLGHDTATDTFTLSWWGRENFYYFLRYSENMLDWSIVPAVFAVGGDEPVHWHFTTGSAGPFFYRLAFTDNVYAEIMQTAIAGDGFAVGWKVLFDLDPLTPLDGESVSVNPALSWQELYDAWRGMLVYYPLVSGPGGVVPDESGNGYDGQLVGQKAWFAEVDGITALRVEGDRSGVVLPVAPELAGLSGGSHTLSLWFKASHLPGEYDSQVSFGLVTRNHLSGVHLRANGRFYARFYQDGPDGDVSVQRSSPVYDNWDRWYHLCQVVDYDGGEVRLYVDGQRVASGAFDPALPAAATNQPWRVGFRNTATNNWSSHGYLSDVRLYDRALDDAQAGSLYLMVPALLQTHADGLAAWWKLHHYGTLNVDPNGVFGGTEQSNLDVYQQHFEPPAPAGLHLVERTLGHVDIAWNASSHDTGIRQYLIFRNGLFVGATASTGYRDSGFSLPADRGLQLNYRVVAQSGVGILSGLSSLLSVTVGEIVDTSPAVEYRSWTGTEGRGYPEFVVTPEEERKYYAHKALAINRGSSYNYASSSQFYSDYYGSSATGSGNINDSGEVVYSAESNVYYDPENETETVYSGSVSIIYSEEHHLAYANGPSFSDFMSFTVTGGWEPDGSFSATAVENSWGESYSWTITDGTPYLDPSGYYGDIQYVEQPTMVSSTLDYNDSDSDSGSTWSWSDTESYSYSRIETLWQEISHDDRESLARQHMNGSGEFPDWGQRLVAGPHGHGIQQGARTAASRLRYSDPGTFSVQRFDYRYRINTTTRHNRYRVRWYERFQPEADFGEQASGPEYRNMREILLNGTGGEVHSQVYSEAVPESYGVVTQHVYRASATAPLAIAVNDGFDEDKELPDNADASPVHDQGNRFVLENHGYVWFGVPSFFGLYTSEPEGSLTLSTSGSGSVRLIAVRNPSLQNPASADWVQIPAAGNLLGGFASAGSPYRSWVQSSYTWGQGFRFYVEGLSPGEVTLTLTRQLPEGTFKIEQKLVVVKVDLEFVDPQPSIPGTSFVNVGNNFNTLVPQELNHENSVTMNVVMHESVREEFAQQMTFEVRTFMGPQVQDRGRVDVADFMTTEGTAPIRYRAPNERRGDKCAHLEILSMRTFEIVAKLGDQVVGKSGRISVHSRFDYLWQHSTPVDQRHQRALSHVNYKYQLGGRIPIYNGSLDHDGFTKYHPLLYPIPVIEVGPSAFGSENKLASTWIHENVHYDQGGSAIAAIAEGQAVYNSYPAETDWASIPQSDKDKINAWLMGETAAYLAEKDNFDHTCLSQGDRDDVEDTIDNFSILYQALNP